MLMRLALGLLSLSLFATGGARQLGAAGQHATEKKGDAYSIRLVENLLRNPTQLGAGFAEREVSRLGDRVSIALLKVLGEEELSSPQKIRTFLPLIRSAFLSPELISIAEDREPKVTVFLLKHLESEAKDPRLKEELTQLIRYVKEKTAAGG
jgi:hypothetical protein